MTACFIDTHQNPDICYTKIRHTYFSRGEQKWKTRPLEKQSDQEGKKKKEKKVIMLTELNFIRMPLLITDTVTHEIYRFSRMQIPILDELARGEHQGQSLRKEKAKQKQTNVLFIS